MARYDQSEALDKVTAAGLLSERVTPSKVILGMTLMSAAMFTAPVMDVIAKYLGTIGGVSPGVVTLGRFGVQAMFLFFLLMILLGLGRKTQLWPKNVLGNLIRGALMGFAAFLFFTAVTFMPVADAIAIFFLVPFIVTILSMPLLSEVVGWRRGVAILFGFGGALLVIQPSFKELGLVTLLPVCAAFIFASYLILTRKIASSHDDPLAMQFAAGVGGTLTLIIALFLGHTFSLAPLRVVLPDTSFLWGLIILLGLIGTGSHLLIVMAFARVRASVLAPFQYIEIISATALGYFVFNEFPNTIKWLGITIIIGSGVFIFWREAQLSKLEEKAT